MSFAQNIIILLSMKSTQAFVERLSLNPNKQLSGLSENTASARDFCRCLVTPRKQTSGNGDHGKLYAWSENIYSLSECKCIPRNVIPSSSL